jgi:hypothetical protein
MFCNYSSLRKFDLKRHHNARHSTKLETIYETRAPAQNVPPFSENVPPFSENVPPFSENVPPFSENVPPKNTCSKCNKSYKNERYVKLHEEKCKGVDVLTCPRCMISFTTRQHKSKHIKADKCKPRSIIHARTPNIQNIYNGSSVNNNIETQNNIGNQNITQNIIINSYGFERTDYLTYEDLKHLLMQGENTIPIYIEKKHFDKDFPENNNILYCKKEKQCQVYENNNWKKKNLSLLSSKLLKENSGELLNFCNDNKEQLSNDIQNDDTFEYIKYKLLYIYHKYDEKYKDIYNMVRDIIINSY